MQSSSVLLVVNCPNQFRRLPPLFVRRTHEVGELLPELYLHGLFEGDVALAL